MIQMPCDNLQICMGRQMGACRSSQASAIEDGASKMTEQHPASSFSISSPAQASHLPPEEAVCHLQTVSAWLADPARSLQGLRPLGPQGLARQTAAGPACPMRLVTGSYRNFSLHLEPDSLQPAGQMQALLPHNSSISRPKCSPLTTLKPNRVQTDVFFSQYKLPVAPFK